MANRSRVYPLLRYRDPRAAIDFLIAAFDCMPMAVHEAGDGTIARADLRLGDSVVMIGRLSPDLAAEGRTASGGSASLYVSVDFVDAHHDRAAAAGARITRPPADADDGSRSYACRDLEGYEWSFGTPAPLTCPTD